MNLESVAGRFTALVERCDRHEWSKKTDLSEADRQTMLDAVRAAGFEDAKEVAHGPLRGNYLDQDGSPNGMTYPVNGWTQFKVIYADGSDWYQATAWLDQLVGVVIRKDQGDFPFLDQRVSAEIERSRPLLPIQLNVEGDMLCEYLPSGTGLVDHQRDGHQISTATHGLCRGFVDRIAATATHDALHCRACHMRILFPKELKTYGDLRRYMAQKLGLQPAAPA